MNASVVVARRAAAFERARCVAVRIPPEFAMLNAMEYTAANGRSSSMPYGQSLHPDGTLTAN
jgi:hypothetical protein